MSQWNIQLPKNYDLRSLTKWAEQCLENGVPREIIDHALLSQNFSTLSLRQMEAKSKVEHNISWVMLDRNLRGIEFEKNGQIDEAIELYESNVNDWFSGNHPYDRLRVIYAKRGQLKDAIRICETFVKVADELISLGSPRGDLPVKRDKFAELSTKLKTKLEAQKKE